MAIADFSENFRIVIAETKIINKFLNEEKVKEILEENTRAIIVL